MSRNLFDVKSVFVSANYVDSYKLLQKRWQPEETKQATHPKNQEICCRTNNGPHPTSLIVLVGFRFDKTRIIEKSR